MFGIFNNPKREARGLLGDARVIIENVSHTYQEQRLREIACQTRDDLAHVEMNCEANIGSLKRELDRHTSLHRDARRSQDPVALTAHTLVIINIRASILGEPGQAVIELIGEFVQTWCEGEPQVAVLAG